MAPTLGGRVGTANWGWDTPNGGCLADLGASAEGHRKKSYFVTQMKGGNLYGKYGA